MKEIEVKAKVKDFDSVINKLKELGCELSDPVAQDDKIFLSKDTAFSEIKMNTNVVRIRNQEGRATFNLKKPQSNEMDCIERETIVDNPKQMEEILDFLGFRVIVRVNKTRRKCQYGDYEICLDEVKDLGSFIEVEKISDEEGSKVQEELLQFLLKLGINKEDQVLHGYDTLIYNKNKSLRLE